MNVGLAHCLKSGQGQVPGLLSIVLMFVIIVTTRSNIILASQCDLITSLIICDTGQLVPDNM